MLQAQATSKVVPREVAGRVHASRENADFVGFVSCVLSYVDLRIGHVFCHLLLCVYSGVSFIIVQSASRKACRHSGRWAGNEAGLHLRLSVRKELADCRHVPGEHPQCLQPH